MWETYRMLGAEHEADLERDAGRSQPVVGERPARPAPPPHHRRRLERLVAQLRSEWQHGREGGAT